MNSLNFQEVNLYINGNMDRLYQNKMKTLTGLTIDQLMNKNPYLYPINNITRVSKFIENAMDAFLSDLDETYFDNFFKDLAIFVTSKTTNGHKSTAPGMDLEFENNGIYHVVSIKSGPNWGNSSQHHRLATDFAYAERRLRQSNHVQMVQKVLGICYGKAKTASTNDGYIKIVGQNFWTLISENKNLYIEIVEPLGYRAKEHNDAFQIECSRIANLLTAQFLRSYCTPSGDIDWAKVIEENSGNYDLDQFFGNKF